uniref:Putative secreted protein n=1 Tax=Ixodes ricinus TaxID=34613 RepID=A0A6B0V147_IXORI
MSGFAALVAHGLVLVLLAADELGRPAVVLGDAGAQGPSHELLLVERGHTAGRRVAVHEQHEGNPFALPGLLVLHHGHPAKRAKRRRRKEHRIQTEREMGPRTWRLCRTSRTVGAGRYSSACTGDCSRTRCFCSVSGQRSLLQGHRGHEINHEINRRAHVHRNLSKSCWSCLVALQLKQSGSCTTNHDNNK